MQIYFILNSQFILNLQIFFVSQYTLNLTYTYSAINYYYLKAFENSLFFSSLINHKYFLNKYAS